jgi:hypothetical protein
MKPLAVASVIFAVFLLFLVASRMDMSIVKSVAMRQEEDLQLARRNVRKLVDAESRLIKQLLSAFENFQVDRELGKLRDMQQVVEASVKIGRARIMSVGKPDAVQTKVQLQLLAKLERRVAVIQAAHAEVVPFYLLDPSIAKEEKRKEAAKRTLERLGRELEGLEHDIEDLILQL